MSGAPRNRLKQLASAARQERDPRKFMHLVKQLYDLLNNGEEADDGLPDAEGEAGVDWRQAAQAARKGRAA
jgi:hypothetical protein